MGILDFHFYLCFSLPKKYLSSLVLCHLNGKRENVSERRMYTPPIDLQAILYSHLDWAVLNNNIVVKYEKFYENRLVFLCVLLFINLKALNLYLCI